MFRRRLPFARVLLIGVFLIGCGSGPPLGAAESSDSAAKLVARSIEHHGGAAYTASKTTLLLCSKSGCSKLEVTRDGGLYEYCVATKIKAGKRRVCSTNDRVEELIDGKPVIGTVAPGSPAHGKREESLRDWVMARVYFAFLPSRLDDPSVRLEDLGTEQWDGRALRKIKVTFEPGTSTDADDEFLYWFDPETARLEQFAYGYATSGGGLRFRKLTNYRRVGSILFFDQENYGIDGPDLFVDVLDPASVSELRHVSTVELRDIRVAPLE